MSAPKPKLPEFKNQSPRYTLGFNLEPEINPRPIPPKIENTETLRDQLLTLNELVAKAESLLYHGGRLDRKLRIRKTWLKTFARLEYFQKGGNNPSLIEIEQVGYLPEKIDTLLDGIITLVANLNTQLGAKQEAQNRKSEIGELLTQLLTKPKLVSLRSLFQDGFLHSTKLVEFTELGEQLQKVEGGLRSLGTQFLSSKSKGAKVETVSLNYYTVRKKKIDYSETRKKVDQNLEDIKKEYKKLTTKKSEQKKALEEFLNQPNPTLEKLKRYTYIVKYKDDTRKEKELTLFRDFKYDESAQFAKLLNVHREIQELGKLINQAIQDNNHKEIAALNRQLKTKTEYKGIFFEDIFGEYRKHCQIFKKVAHEYGRQNAFKRNIIKAELAAKQSRCWGVLLRKQNETYLLTIPEQSLAVQPSIRDSLKQLQQQRKETGDYQAYHYNSLTLRALEKLCFGFLFSGEGGEYQLHGTENTFAPEVAKELGYDAYRRTALAYQTSNKELDEQGLISFYQKVLATKAAQKSLSVKITQKLIKKDFYNLEKFAVYLEKSTYTFTPYWVSTEDLNTLCSRYRGRLEKLSGRYLHDRPTRQHTDIWQDFWSQNLRGYRLNPEIKISYVAAQESTDKNKVAPRRRKDKFLAQVSLNRSFAPLKTNTFQKAEEFKNNLEEIQLDYNSEIKQQNPFNYYFYGLDRGSKELLSLSLYQFSDIAETDGLNPQGNIHKRRFVPFKVWELAPEDYKLEIPKQGGVSYAYLNPSRFVDSLQEREFTEALDLSMAKMIKGKLVLNGDITTYLKFIKERAKNTIYSRLLQGNDLMQGLSQDGRGIYMEYVNRGKTEEEYIYYWHPVVVDLKLKEKIFIDLRKHYKNSLKFLERRTAVSTKNVAVQKQAQVLYLSRQYKQLLSALSANMVGVLDYLLTEFPGFMVLETTPGKQTDKVNLSSYFEKALWRKFETKKLVPEPTIQLNKYVEQLGRDKHTKQSSHQFGLIVYVPEQNTSKQCPVCRLSKTNNREEKDTLKALGIYHCDNSNCDFRTEDNRLGFTEISNPDALACYNIALRGLEHVLESTKR